jgi:hypothetical protein
MSKEDTYDITKPNPCNPDISSTEEVATALGSADQLHIGKGCGFTKSNIAGPGDQGIHVLYRTVVHEVEHAIITCDVWNFTDPSDPTVNAGYSSDWDKDGDGYKDLWETTSIEGMLNNFTVTLPGKAPFDGYNVDKNTGLRVDASGNPISYDPNKLGLRTPLYSAGTEYEEARCKNKELTITKAAIDKDDWSFDYIPNPPINPINPKTKIIQGKQW